LAGAAAVLAVALSACTGAGSAYLLGAEVASVINTEKSLTDHALSAYMKEDCAIANVFSGEDICKAPPPKSAVAAAAPVYCYRNIAGISCYDRPDPYTNGQNPLPQ